MATRTRNNESTPKAPLAAAAETPAGGRTTVTAPCAEVSMSVTMVDLRPVYAVGREPFKGHAPPAPSRIDLTLSEREAHTLRIAMDGFQKSGTRCETGAEAVRLLLRTLRTAYDETINTKT